jgi:cytochrome d ubiquinol oxidase subunit I
VVEARLLLTYIRKGAEPLPPPPDHDPSDPDRPLAFAY